MVAIGQVCQQENLNRTIVLHIEIGYRINSIYFRIKMLALNLFFFPKNHALKLHFPAYVCAVLSPCSFNFLQNKDDRVLPCAEEAKVP